MLKCRWGWGSFFSFCMLIFLLGIPVPVMADASCPEWVGRLVSLQGTVEVRRVGEAGWQAASLEDTFCFGDTIRVLKESRAAVQLQNDALLRLDQETTLTISDIENERTFIIDLLKGAAHFFSRGSKSLKVVTPYVNAAVEGTEFEVRVTDGEAQVTLMEGRVLLENDQGEVTLAKGQVGVARADAAPTASVTVSPRDAVKWALYYPRVVQAPSEGSPASSDAERLVRQAGDKLSLGRVGAAEEDIDTALFLEPDNGDAISLKAIIAVVNNRKEEAMGLAEKAVAAAPDAASARMALSYALQAAFDLDGALAELETAVELEPENALAWARLSELRLSLEDADGAFIAARRATALQPDLSHIQSVLGYAYLAQVKIDAAQEAFETAISLDSSAPLPQLGLGLTKIRRGDLAEGRRLIEVAAGLDPGNSVFRSYLGKAYFEEKRDKFSADQLVVAKELDPNDPTPWLYDAIRKQSMNRPVEALKDVQKSIELNDNRAVYRSSLHLDEDLAARNVALGEIYKEIGFDQLAIGEGYRSLNESPDNYSAHRFLSDAYASLPRHGIARVSELLQAQLLQPVSLTPVSPQLSESSLFVHRGVGPSSVFVDSYDTLFHQDGLNFQLNTAIGGNDTLGSNAVFSGAFDKMFFSLGQYYYDTDGFRENNDQELEIYNAFFQYALNHKTSLQAEFRYKDKEYGDLQLRFDPDNYLNSQRNSDRGKSVRFGFRHGFTNDSVLIGSAIVGESKSDFSVDEMLYMGPFEIDMGLSVFVEKTGGVLEMQQLLQWESCSLILGGSYFFTEIKERTAVDFTPDVPMLFADSNTSDVNDTNNAHFYLYSTFNNFETFSYVLGAGIDFFDDDIFGDISSFNPKIGIDWKLSPRTTLRGAVFRTLWGNSISEQTIEPTQVMGFNQFYDDVVGSKIWKYGIGIEHEFSDTLYAGAEVTTRDIETGYVLLSSGEDVVRLNEDEESARGYISWVATPSFTLTGEYMWEALYRDERASVDNLLEVKTNRFPLTAALHHPLGLSSLIKASYVSQKGEFGNTTSGFVHGSDYFWIVDAEASYLLPKRYGRISLLVKNLFDEEIEFQDTDPANPDIYPQRLILLKLSAVF